MMDLSSVVDASLVVAGVIGTLMMGMSALSSDSTTVSTHSEQAGRQAARTERSILPKAA